MRIAIVETTGMKCKVCDVHVPFEQYGWICPCCFPRDIRTLHNMQLTLRGLFSLAKFVSYWFKTK